MTNRVKMKVEFDVTPAQGLALQTMFEHWNKMAAWGCSRKIAFYVDGDGNFKPNSKVEFDGDVPELTDELREAAAIEGTETGDVLFDFDPIAWKINN